ncbi:MAG TPA: arylamine N-acetyltransferase [Pirellulales bacterium]|nr:arylamine N-acetyltransferase [Pirellulales bacterium]
MLDLDAYFQRIGYDGSREPTLQTFAAVHLAHATQIPFENLDIHLGRPIQIDLASIQAKLVHSRRGGYCFEHNTLLAAALEELGFRVTALAARVRLGASRVLSKTHMLLMVDLESPPKVAVRSARIAACQDPATAPGAPWLADVGFGTGGLLAPLPLTPEQVSQQHGRSYRLTREEPQTWVLQSLSRGAWHDLYAFTLEPHYPIDYEMANHYISTHPASRFVQTLVAQRQTLDACHLLRNREHSVVRGDDVRVRTIMHDEELLQVLDETFGISLPPGCPVILTSGWCCATSR